MLLFTDGSDLAGVTKSMDIEYMKLTRLLLNLVGAWPLKQIDGNTSKIGVCKRCFLVFVTTGCIICQIKYIRAHLGTYTFLFLGHSYITVLMTVVTLSRYVLTLFDNFHQTTTEFVKILHLFNHRHKGAQFMKTHIFIHKISNFFSLYLVYYLLVVVSLFNLAPLYNNIKSGIFWTGPINITYRHSVYYAIPIDYETNLNGYIFIFFLNCLKTTMCSISFGIVDLLLSLMVFHLWGHLKILIHTLENFPKPGFMSNSQDRHVREPLMYSEEEMKVTHKKLGDCISHHQLITEFGIKMSNTFGLTLLVYYCFHQLCGCLLLLECMQMDPGALMNYAPLTVVLFQQLIQISLVFELLGSESDKLSDAVYSVPWESMNHSNRKIVLTFLRQSQKPMNLKALNMVTIGAQTMAKILKTTISYYLMLQTVTKNEK